MSAHNAPAPDQRERPIGELVKDLAGQTSTLVRQEIKLAQAELTTKGKVAGRGAGMLAGAAVPAPLMLGAPTACRIASPATPLPLWLAAVVLTPLWGVTGARPPHRGRQGLRPATPPPPQP